MSAPPPKLTAAEAATMRYANGLDVERGANARTQRLRERGLLRFCASPNGFVAYEWTEEGRAALAAAEGTSK